MRGIWKSLKIFKESFQNFIAGNKNSPNFLFSLFISIPSQNFCVQGSIRVCRSTSPLRASCPSSLSRSAVSIFYHFQYRISKITFPISHFKNDIYNIVFQKSCFKYHCLQSPFLTLSNITCQMSHFKYHGLQCQFSYHFLSSDNADLCSFVPLFFVPLQVTVDKSSLSRFTFLVL